MSLLDSDEDDWQTGSSGSEVSSDSVGVRAAGGKVVVDAGTSLLYEHEPAGPLVRC